MSSSDNENTRKTDLGIISLGILRFRSNAYGAFTFETADNKEKVLDSIKNNMMIETTTRNVIFIVPMILSIFKNRKFNVYTVSFLVFNALHLLIFFFFGKKINEVTLALLMSLSFLNNLIEMLFCSGYKIVSGVKEIGSAFTVFNLLAEAAKAFMVYKVFDKKENYLKFFNVQSSPEEFSENNLPMTVIHGEYYTFVDYFYVIVYIEILFKILKLKKMLNRYYDNKNDKKKFSLFWMFIFKFFYLGFVHKIVEFLFMSITNGAIEKQMEETRLPRTDANQTMVRELFECVYQLSSLEHFVSSFYNIFSCVILDIASSKEFVLDNINEKTEPNEELV